MATMFNTILAEGGLIVADVRLLRHKDKTAAKGRTPYELWHNARQQFEIYQSLQKIRYRKTLNVRYWASFIGTPTRETMFVGMYRVKARQVLSANTPNPANDEIIKAGSHDLYDLVLENDLTAFIGKLFIDWGPAPIVWIQYADRQNKRVTKLLEDL